MTQNLLYNLSPEVCNKFWKCFPSSRESNVTLLVKAYAVFALTSTVTDAFSVYWALCPMLVSSLGRQCPLLRSGLRPVLHAYGVELTAIIFRI